MDGPFGSNLPASCYTSSGIPVIRGGNLAVGLDRFNARGFVFVSEETAQRLERSLCRAADVVFTKKGTLGQTGFIPADAEHDVYLISSNQMKLSVDRTIAEPLYVYYCVSSKKSTEKILRDAEATGVPKTNLAYLKTFPILLPPLPEQKAIARVLGALDDKIELNRRMNETLEATARAIFKSWFVDFDPVRAKAEGRAPEGLDPATAALFPDRLVDSEIGEIPQGWSVGTVADVASLNPESWSKDTRPDIINYVDLSNTKWGRIEAVTVYTKQDAPSRAQRVLRLGDSIIGTVRPGNGSYAFIAEEGLTGSTGFAVMRPQRIEHAEFVYLASTASENIEALSHLADGAAYPAVRPEVVAATPVVLPADRAISEFAKGAGSLLTRMAMNERESHTLAAIRDALLPKLLSGELRVKDVEKLVGGRP